MKHSAAELIDVVHHYFPVGYWPEDVQTTIEYQRRLDAHNRAKSDYPVWRLVLRRLRDSFPNVEVRNESLRFEASEAVPIDRCFAGTVELPPRSNREQNHRLGFRLSFVVPYYFLYSTHQLTDVEGLDFRIEFSFTEDEIPFATAIEREMAEAFPQHEKMSTDVGKIIVPNIATSLRLPDEATLFDCLFSDHW